MKKNSIFKLVLLVILCVSVCTWIFPGLQYNGQLVDGERQQVGIFDLFAYLVEVCRYFPYVVLTTLSIGAFYGVAYRIPAYRELLDRLVSRFKGKENIFLVAVIALTSIIVSVTGLTIGMLFVFPLIIALVLLMGYNKLVAASVTVGSVAVGLLGTTLGTTTTYYANYILGTTYTSEMVTKIILLLIGIAVLSYNVISYGKKIKNDTDKVLEFVPGNYKRVIKTEEKVEEKEVKVEKEEKKIDSKTKKTDTKKKVSTKKSTKTRANDLTTDGVKVVKTPKKVKFWPFVLVFDLVLVVLGISMFDWTTVTSSTWPKDALNAVRDFSIGGFPIFDKLFGSSLHEFGSWSLNYEVPAFIILATIFLGFIYGLKVERFFEGMLDGIKRASKPAFYMTLVYVVLIVVTYHPFQLQITKFLLDLTKGLNVVTMAIVAMFSSLFNIESAYVAQSTLPYVTSVITDTSVYPIIAVIFQAIYGLMMLVAPTSVILLGTLSYLEIPYVQWLKHVWKIFLELLLVLVVVFLILVLI